MSTFPYDALVFDLDGTLFDAEEGIISSVKYAMQKLGCPIPQDADLREVVGPPLRDSFRGLLGVPAERVEEAVSFYMEDFGSRGMYLYSLYPHIRSILHMLSRVSAGTTRPARTHRSIPRATCTRKCRSPAIR